MKNLNKTYKYIQLIMYKKNEVELKSVLLHTIKKTQKTKIITFTSLGKLKINHTVY